MRKNLLNIIITTKRLSLKPILMEYKEEIYKEFTKDITTFMIPRPAKDISETEDFINDSIEKLKGGTNLQLVILDKETKEFLGCAGLHEVGKKNPELGIWVKKSAHGQALGKETIIALKEWADENLDYNYILYPVDEENIPSRKIAEALGGKIAREYDQKTIGGNILRYIEYRIYKF